MASGVADGALIVDTKIDNSGSKRGAAEFKRQVDGMNKAVDQAGKSMASSLNGYLRSVGKTKGAAKQLEKEIASIESQIQQLQQRQREWDAMGFKTTSAAFEELDQQIFSLQDKLDGLIAKRKELENQPSGGGMAQQVRETTQNVSEAEGKFGSFEAMVGRSVTGVVRMAGAWAKAGATIARIAGGGALSFLRKLAAGAKNAAVQLAKLTGRAIVGGFKTLGGYLKSAGRWMLGLGKSGRQTNGGFKQGFMTFLRYGLGIRGLFALFRRLRSAIAEGLGELYKQNPAVKSSIDGLKAALNGLKASLATAFAPIVSAVAPALTKLINMLTAAINTIGAFIAALTGQRTYQRAVSGLNATGSAAGGAASEVKELNRQLAGFDELNILNDKNSGSGGGGGGGGAGGGFTYETAEIASGITDFVGKLKEMWAEADYDGIGRTIAGSINKAFEKARQLISWENLGAKITEAVNAITGIFNGLVDGIDWDLIGRTFGTGINTIIKTANQLLTKIDWENLGKKLAEGLNGLVSEVNWDEFGQLLANKLNAAFDTLKGAVTTFNWGDFGKKFNAAVSNLVATVNWDTLGKTLAALLNGALDFLQNALGDFAWAREAVRKFVGAVNNLVATVGWDTLGKTLAALLNGAFDILRDAITTFDWGNFGRKFNTAVSNLVSKVNWDTIGKTLAALMNGALDFLQNALGDFTWARTAVRGFVGAVNNLVATVNWESLGKTLAKLLNGAFDTFKDAVTTFAWGDIGKKFNTAVSNLVAKVNWDTLGKTLAALLNGALEFLTNAIGDFSWGRQAIRKFVGAVNNLVATVDWNSLGVQLAALLDIPFKALKTALSTFDFGDAGTQFAKAVNGFFSNKELFEDAGDTFNKTLNGVLDFGIKFFENFNPHQFAASVKLALGRVDWKSIARKMFDLLKKAFWSLGLTLTDLFSPTPGIGRKVVDQLSPIQEDDVLINSTTGEVLMVAKPGPGLKEKGGKWELDKSVDALITLVRSGWTEVTKWLGLAGVVSANIGLVKNNWTTIEKFVGTAVTVATSLKKNGWTDIAKFVGDAVTVATSLKKNGWTTIAGYVGTAVDVETSLKKNGWTTIAGYVGTAVTVLTSLSKSGWSTISDFVGTAVTAAVSLSKSGWSSIAGYVGTAVDVLTSLSKDGWSTISDYVGTSVTVGVKLKKIDWESAKKWIAGNKDGKVTLTVDLKEGKKVGSTLKSVGKIKKKAGGGIVTAGGVDRGFASGGIIRGGIARYLAGAPHYASGTTRAHGTVFVAGEAGPEIMGHLNGRTEILNRSQIAQAIYGAVVSGMGAAVNALGVYLANHITSCTNAITSTIGSVWSAGGLSGLPSIQYHSPVMATGSVLPYDVAAQIAKSGEDICNTLDANNEDLIQTIISVIGAQTTAIVTALRSNGQTRTTEGINVQQFLNEINRQTLMFGASPLKGV